MDKKKARRPAKRINLLPGSLKTLARKGKVAAIKTREGKQAHGRPKGINATNHLCTQEIIDKARHLASLGAPDYVIACRFGISAVTMHKWVKKITAFKEAIIQGRAERVEKLLMVGDELLDGKDDGTKHLATVRQKAIEYEMNRLFTEHNRNQFIILQQQSETEDPVTPATLSWKSIKEDMYSVDTEKEKFTKLKNNDLQQ